MSTESITQFRAVSRPMRVSWSWLFEDDVLPKARPTLWNGMRYVMSVALLVVLTVVALLVFRQPARTLSLADADGSPTANRIAATPAVWDDWFRLPA
jgi:hypothetical protein